MDLNTFGSFFKSDYMPHGHCYLWQPHILWTNVVSDFLIAAAYFSLPIAIMMFSVKRKDIGYNAIFLLFSLFILFCGITHVIGIFTIWHGIYGVHGVSKAITALVSVVTAMYVYKLLPTALEFPTLSQFKDVKGKLHAEVETRSLLEAELENKKLVNFVLNSIPLSTLLLDEHQNIVFYNQTFLDEFKGTYNELDNTNRLANYVKFNESDNKLVEEFLVTSPETSHQLSLNAVTISKGEPIEVVFEQTVFEDQQVILVTIKNLAEMSQIKTELVESHQRLERAISATEDGIWEWNVETGDVQYSPKLMEIIGKKGVEAPTFNDWFSHIHEDYKDKVKGAIDKHFETREKYIVEYLGIDRKQNYSWFVAIGDSIFDDAGNPIVMSGSLRNIDLTKRLEKLNRENQGFINAIYEGSSHAIWVLKVEDDNDFIFEQYNEAACNWTGIAPEQIIGKRLSKLSGTVFPEEVASKLHENYFNCATQKNKLDYIEELSITGAKAWYKTTLYPILNSEQQVIKIVGTAIDVTNEQVLLAKLKESNDYLERFAFAASHDLQEPLRKIMAFSQLLKERLKSYIENDEDANYEFSRLSNSANRMRVMIDDILKLSRINTSKLSLTKCKLSDILNEVSDTLSAKIKESNTIIKLDNAEVELYVDPTLTALLFQNIVSNAIKFQSKDVQPCIEFSVEDTEQYVSISCKDNGIGISQEFVTQIFEPFRRLHTIAEYEGSGIGLALCQQIMKVHGGSIRCESALGEGSCFTIVFNK